MPLIRGEMLQRPSPIGFQSGTQFAWIDNRFKIYSADEGKSWELYDLIEDPGETRDLAAAQPDRLKSMAAAFEEWRASCTHSNLGKDYGKRGANRR